jgi:uncharacterized protein
VATDSTQEVKREDWPLLLLSRDVLGVDGPEALDPIRVQKGIFLLSQRGPKRGIYSFRPYNWGPFSSELYGDLDLLAGLGMVTREHEPGRSWSRFKPTQAGILRAEEAAGKLKPDALEWIGRVRRFLTTRSFDKLLDDVYAAFPEFATESLYRR